MKKPIIAIIGLLAAAGISTGAFLAVKNTNDKSIKEQNDILADNVLFNFDSSNINEVTINTPEGESYFIEKGDNINSWSISNSENNFSLNADTLKSLCNTISVLTANTNYGAATDENKERYGLNKPYTLTVSDGTDSYTIHIGDKSPTGDYYYVCVDGKDNIYAIDSSEAEDLIPDQLALMNNDFTTYGDGDIVGITLKKNGNIVYDLKYNKEKGLWELPEKYALLSVNQTSITSMIANITRFQAEQIVDGNVSNPDEYGFDKAAAELVLTGNDGSQETLLFLHQSAAADTYTKVFLKNSNQLELYYTADMKFINYTVFDFIMQTIENANMYAISEVTFNGQSAEDTFSVDIANGTLSCRGTDVDVTNNEMLSLFESFYNSFSYIAISDIDVYAKPDINDSVFTADYKYPDGKSFSISLVPTDGSKYYIFADGSYTGTLTEAKFLTGSDSVFNLYESFCSHAGISPVQK